MTPKTSKNSPVSGQSTYLNAPPRVIEIKRKTSKWDLIKLKSLCTAKEAINKMKIQPTEWKKIIANDAANKGLISKIYKQLIQLNNKTNTSPPIKRQKT